MPCAAGNLCKMPSNTPGPLFYTIHKCCKCGGYLHGICGVKDPELDDDCKRLCEGQCLALQQVAGADGKGALLSTSSLGSLNGSLSGAAAGSRRQKSSAPSRRGHGSNRSNLTLDTKSEVLDHLKNKKLKVTFVAKKFNIAERTARKIRAEEEKIMEQLHSRPGAGKAKSLKGPRFPEVDKIALVLFEEVRDAKLPSNRATLQMPGRKARDQLLSSAKSDEECQRLSEFNASENWVTNFVIRNNLKSMLLHGEAGSIDEEAIANGMATVRKEYENYDLDNIFNVDETGLFYRMLPQRT